MFLHLSVSHSAHVGGVSASGSGGCTSGSSGGVSTTPLGQTHPSNTAPQTDTHTPRDIPPSVETATEAGGTHPTGMHSCFHLSIILFIADP